MAREQRNYRVHLKPIDGVSPVFEVRGYEITWDWADKLSESMVITIEGQDKDNEVACIPLANLWYIESI